jgi:ribosomal silencing factor RsfS
MISKDSIDKIKSINELSLKLHGSKEKHMEYVLKSMQHHAEEINDLFKKGNPHWSVETGDLMIHCMCMLVLNGYDLNEMFETCRKRFLKKVDEELKKK